MPQTTESIGREKPQRYRLPGIEREGIAQLSLLESALWPLRGGKLPTSTFETTHAFTAAGERRVATVRVFAPLGLQSIDEYVLWGLLGLSLDRRNVESTLLATPYWIMQRLGMQTGGFQYDQLRESLERIASVAYQNTGFWNPVSQQHERTTFHFFSSFIPTRGRGGEIAADRVWRIEWDKHFFELCRATGGTLLFDLDVYRELTPAARRLFLKVKDRFWRMKKVYFNVNDLTINGLGFSAERPLKKRKYDLCQCLRELMDHGIVELGRGHSDPSDLFIRRGKGLYIVVLFEGEYFRQPLSNRVRNEQDAISADPLHEPLAKIGLDAAAIRRVFKKCSRSQIQRWIKITDAAMHENPRGFPGFRVSPAAFFIDAVENQRMPPDWIYQHEKRQGYARWQNERTQFDAGEQLLAAQYQEERSAARDTYLQSLEGRERRAEALREALTYYQSINPDHAYELATDAANGKVEREHFQFPEFGVWMLEQNRLAR